MPRSRSRSRSPGRCKSKSKSRRHGRRKRSKSPKQAAKYKSEFRVITYGDKRKKSPSWKRDRRRRRGSKGRSRSGSRERRRSGSRERRRSGSRGRSGSGRRSKSPRRRSPEVEEEEVKKRLTILSIDYNIKENTVKHHTDQYECTEEQDENGKKTPAELVVRRGQPFVITLTLDREYNKKNDDMDFVFTTGSKPKPPKGTAASFQMDENSNGKAHHKSWYAKLKRINGLTIDVEITSPSICIIGEWDFSIRTSSVINKRAIWQKEGEPITILFNPWCEHDDTYLPKTDLLNEYILNDKGAIFQGNHKQICAKVWNFLQFEDDILDICLHLIRSHFGGNPDPVMADPVALSRVITEIVNAQDGGVLVGNWSGNYKDGCSPSLWSGSARILQQYFKTNQSVKYGQCWVFSGVTTTVCRALGIPCRSVTNFSSAHDSDGSVAIDKEYAKDENGKLKPRETGDSIWNFHVWNEVWLARNDLGIGYEGWQVIDSTPQELSYGEFRCGPASVRAIKRGELGRMQYDCPFVYAEVNADVVRWELLSDCKWKKIGVDTRKVGKKISTKIPDGRPYEKSSSIFFWRNNDDDGRLDITNEYKYPEGSLEERLSVKNANKASVSDRKVQESEHDDVVLEIVDKDGVLYGEEFEVEVKLRNQSIDHKVRTVTNLEITVEVKSYNGDIGKTIVEKDFEDIRMKYNEEKTLKLNVGPDEYIGKFEEQYMMEITATAHVKETDKVHIAEDDFRLRRPDLEIEAPDRVQRNKPFKVDITLDNPMQIPMTNLVLNVDGCLNEIEEKISGKIDKKSKWKHTVTVTPRRIGTLSLVITLDSDELKDVAGYANVQVEA